MGSFRNPVRLAVLGVMLAFVVLLIPATALAANVPVGASPVDVAIDTGLGKAFVANYYGNSVSVIDASNAVVATVDCRTYPDPNQSYPNAVAVNSTTHRAYVANYVSPDIVVIDTNTNARLGVVPNPAGWNNFAKDVLVDEGLDLVYVANWNGGVEVYQGLAVAPFLTHVASVPCGLNPYAMALNQSTHKVYVANANGGSITVIDATEAYATTTIPVGTTPTAVAVNGVTNKVYVANNGSNDVSVIDGATNTVLKTVPVGLRPEAIAIDTRGNTVYVANLYGHTVSVVNGTFDTVLTTVPAGAYPQDVAVDEVYSKVYVANQNSDVTVIDAANGYATTSASAGTLPMVVEVDPVTHRAYVVNKTSNDVTILELVPPTSFDVSEGHEVYYDPATGVFVQFTTVTSPGDVTVSMVPATGNTYNQYKPPNNFSVKGDAYYEITTTATYTGTIYLSFSYPQGWQGSPNPKLYHWGNNGTTQHVHGAVGAPLPSGTTMLHFWLTVPPCGYLSPFAILEPTDEVAVSTPASSPWSLVALAALGLGAATVVRRVTRTT